MADIFLSYNREDAAVAKLFAEAFAREGMEVWWDATLRSGEDYDKVTEAALHEAKAVVVLWSPRSVVSRWVRAEATVADQNKTLMPVTIEACRRPVMFELKQTADLSHWRGAKNDKVWLTFLAHVRQLVVDGAERAAEAPSPGAVRSVVGRTGFWRSGRNRIAVAVAAALLIVGAGVAYRSRQPAEQLATVASTHQEAGSTPVAVKQAGISLAVLPFVNLSGDAKQEFFSDGMTEEITAALAKVRGLNVIGRTSAFQFKGQHKDLRAIGQALGANHLIDGSVRKEGNEVRITVELIRADGGTHLWTETYTRELKGVFAVQEEIAKAIAGALQVPLGLKAGQSLVANRTEDTQSYQDYLQARALFRARGALEPGGPLTQAASLLEKAVARDPNYAPAWGMLAQTYSITPVYTAAFYSGSTDDLRRITADLVNKAENAAEKAIRLNPDNVDEYVALAQVRRMRGSFAKAEDAVNRALSLDPENPDALHSRSYQLSNVGRVKEALALRLHIQVQEPFVPVYKRVTAQILWENGQNDEAISMQKPLASTASTVMALARSYATVGRYHDAVETLQGMPSGIFRRGEVEEAIRLMSSVPQRVVTPPTTLSKGQLGFVYLFVDAPDRALDFFEGLAEAGAINGSALAASIWAPAYAPVRKTERFKALVRKMGLVDYWRARGWPEFCQPTTGDDFTCH